MPHSNDTATSNTPTSAIDAIYRRRAVRDYTSQQIDRASILELLDAAVHAPTAMDEQPWAFSVVQDKDLLRRLSEHAKKLLTSNADKIHPHTGGGTHDRFTGPDFNVFYNASTLIVICGKPMGSFVISDCWLAAQNLMLAACAKELGTCVIGLAVTALNLPEWKKEFGIPDEMTVFVPIIVGTPAGETPSVPRKQAEILLWN